MKNILFDLDGTITDPQLGIINCIKYALDKLNTPAPDYESLKKYIGPPLWQSFQELLGTDSYDEANEAVMIYRERFSTKGMFENEPFENIYDVLQSLCECGYTLYICTSKPAVFAKQIADHFDFAKYFKEIYGSNLDGTLIDKTELISHILQTENISKENAVMIGDREYDINGALNNGLTPYGVSYGFGSSEELKQASRVFSTPLDISNYFCTN